MKVIEKESDRRAQVNIYVQGEVLELNEYGGYVDPTDKAICCYVPLDEGHKPCIGGRFSGITLAIACDTIVDGILQKATSYAAKTAHQQNKKIDTEHFLYMTTKGAIDTEITVAPLLDVVTAQGDSLETIGTMELRLYVTRQLGVSHDIGDMKKYYSIGGNVEDEQADNNKQQVSYKLIPPTFRMSFEENSALLGDRQPSLHQRRADAKRPGTEPWAIFRFHYRSQDEISERNLGVTFDPTNNKTEPHILMLDPAPSLILGTKPLKNDGDASSRSSSPMPPATPFTPAKSAQPGHKIPHPTKKKPGPKPKSTDATNMTFTTEQADDATPKASLVESLKSATRQGTQDKFLMPLEAPTAEVKKALANRETDNGTSTTTTDTGGDKTVEKIADMSSKPAVAASETVTNPPPLSTTSAKKPIAKPAPNSYTVQKKKSDTPPLATVPAKRHPLTTNGVTPEPKRTRVVPTPLSPSTQLTVSRIPPRSPTPKTVSIERQLADQRKRLEEMRKKHMETAQKQAAIDEQMGPYKHRMAEELERLSREMMEEESAYTEEAEHYSASIDILQEFKKADDK